MDFFHVDCGITLKRIYVFFALVRAICSTRARIAVGRAAGLFAYCSTTCHASGTSSSSTRGYAGARSVVTSVGRRCNVPVVGRGVARTLLLVTGRELDDVERVAPRLDVFERVVAENGGLLYGGPAYRDSVPLADPPPERLVSWLRERDVAPLGVGAVMVATRQPHDVTVLEAIRELGLEQQLIYNKGAVMVLPPGVNNASGRRPGWERRFRRVRRRWRGPRRGRGPATAVRRADARRRTVRQRKVDRRRPGCISWELQLASCRRPGLSGSSARHYLSRL